MAFERELTAFRYAETRFGDDLRRLALRELGDASLWADIATLNGLVPPYLTDDAALAGPGVLLTGAALLVPSPQALTALTTDPELVFGTDVLLVNGRFDFANGDLATISGAQNFVQAIRHLLSTHEQDLIFHPDYGNKTHLLIGTVNGPTAGNLAAFYVRSALLRDERVQEVASVKAEMLGDVIRVRAQVVSISGKSAELNLVI